MIFLLWTVDCGLWTANAAVPHLLNYQGKLTDSSGNPLNGSYSLTFRIYDAETAGSLLWEETQSGVIIQKGIFSILLGSVTNLVLPFDKPYFLEIKVGNEVMSPRQRITSAGYAIRAEKAENAIQTQNSDTIANIGVSSTPQPNKILPLDNNAKLPLSALKVYDSGWFVVSTNTTYTKTHNLGTTKVLITTYLAQNSDGSGWCIKDWNALTESNDQSMVVSLSTAQIVIRTTYTYIAKFKDSNGNQQTPTSGYLRIIMLALE